MLAGLLMTAACDDKPVRPAVPAQLIDHAEIPFGDAVLRKVHRAELAARKSLAPRFGDLRNHYYTAKRGEEASLLAGLPKTIPQGWAPVDDAVLPPEQGTLLAFTKEGRLFALIVVATPPADGDIPVVLLDNFEGR